MVKARYADKAFIVSILLASFDQNSSVNYIIKQDNKRQERIKGLMNYSFNLCFRFGSIFYSEDKKACALILFPEQKKTDLKSILLDITFILSSLDFSHLKKAFGRGAKIKKLQLKGPASYLWFIGVEPSEQGRGVGSRLLQDVLVDLEMKGHPILLETSNLQNVNWYEKMGFTVYDQMDLGYILYFLKKEQNWSVRK